jgi:hypothetical protein
MVWAFLGQVLCDGKKASSQATVSCVVAYCLQKELTIPTADTGDYCRARAKLSVAALRDVTREVAAEVEEQANPAWLWRGSGEANAHDLEAKIEELLAASN